MADWVVYPWLGREAERYVSATVTPRPLVLSRWWRGHEERFVHVGHVGMIRRRFEATYVPPHTIPRSYVTLERVSFSLRPLLAEDLVLDDHAHVYATRSDIEYEGEQRLLAAALARELDLRVEEREARPEREALRKLRAADPAFCRAVLGHDGG